MRNWKSLWDEIKANSPETEWNKLGYQRTAETYFDAVREVAKVFEKKGGSAGGIGPVPSDCEKGSHLKRILSF
jgi:hypothetical protein